MLGIIGAMDVEINGIKGKIENPQHSGFAGIDFVFGTIGGREVCAAQCSPGKVNAALCAQLMIDKFSPEGIINLGVGCSLCKDVVIKNIVVATEVCQYDFDTSAIDGYKGLLIDGKVSLPTDKPLSDALAKCAQKKGAAVHRGCIATGDTFIASVALKESISDEFGALCGEMEGGAVGQVCYINRVPFAVLRTVSDGGDENAQLDYPVFKKIAADISTAILIDFLNNDEL